MLVVDLHCEHGHVFEGWFASADDLASQQARGLVSCPVCASTAVVRRPAASRLNVASLRAEKAPDVAPKGQAVDASGSGAEAPAPSVAALEALYLQAVRHVLSHTEDVGEAFAQEVRDIHRGDAPPRAVRGQADQEEVAALQDEGIDVLALPIPDGLKGPLQ